MSGKKFREALEKESDIYITVIEYINLEDSTYRDLPWHKQDHKQTILSRVSAIG
jgi:hypothetical protein